MKLAFVLMPIISLLFLAFPLFTDPVSYASFFLPYFFLDLACSVLRQGSVRNFIDSENFNLLKMRVLMGNLGGLFQRDSKFTVTPKARASSARIGQLLLPVLELHSGYRFRSHLNVPVRISYTGQSGQVVRCEQFAHDLNRNGVSVSLETAIVPGTAVDVELWLPQRTIYNSGKVVRNREYRRLKLSNGIRFDKISAADQDESPNISSGRSPRRRTLS